VLRFGGKNRSVAKGDVLGAPDPRSLGAAGLGLRVVACVLSVCVFVVVLPRPEAASASISSAELSGGLERSDLGGCDTVLGRLVDLTGCSPRTGLGLAAAAVAPRSVSEPAVVLSGPTAVRVAATVAVVAVPAIEEPCSAGVADQLFEDPLGDWDTDGVSNVFEAYWGADPCDAGDVPVRWSAPAAELQVVPEAVVVRQEPEVAAQVEVVEPETVVVEDAEVVVCPGFSFDDVLADPDGDWDGDRRTNVDEFYGNADPCVAAAEINGAVAVSVPKVTGDVCPAYSLGDVLADPDGDWDGDRRTNADEFYGLSDPCVRVWWQ